MNYVIGFDGGGTKTRCVLGDLQGNILADAISGPSNHQMTGPDTTKNVLKTLFNQVLTQTQVNKDHISFIFLGLAGADIPSDFELLNGICKDLFGQIPFEVVNDSWIIMRSGTKEPYGAVSIYGTGANAAAINSQGKMSILRALGHPFGAAGGGYEISQDALHYAFRSNEKTYKKTALEDHIPKLMGYKDIESLLSDMYPENKLGQDILRKITPLVFDLAHKGDEVCIEILDRKGRTQGEMINGVIEQSGMTGQAFPIILGGSVFKGVGHTFKNSIARTVHSKSPQADFIFSTLEPVAGAYLFALDRIKVSLDQRAYNNLKGALTI